MAEVKGVTKRSVGDKAGIKAGDKVISINGMPFLVSLDLIYAESLEQLTILIEGRSPIKIAKNAYEPLGLIFNESIELSPCRCSNKCVFCFIDQLPRGLRKTLYVKDDDYRYSFITGSYITLTNLKDEDIDRIINYRLSPLYVSVHAYDKAVRKKLLGGNPESDKVWDKIIKLTSNGITLNAQIVMCSELNDGAVMKETIDQLYALYPAVTTVAVVPVGLTCHRDGLFPLRAVTKEEADKAIDIVERLNKDAKNAERGFVWCSDEMYIKAERELPPYQYYGDFMQIENGVGLVRNFLESIDFNKKGNGGEFHLVTGESFYPILLETAKKLEKSSGAKLMVHKINNNFFGKTVTVAGLITAGDIIAQLEGKVEGGTLIIPSEMLREFEDVFLDNITIDELENALNVRIIVERGNLIDIICGDNNG